MNTRARTFSFVAGLLVAAALLAVLPQDQDASPETLADHGSSPVIVATPSAPHPQARVRAVDFDTGQIRFDWLDSEGNPVDTGGSLASVTVTGDTVTAEQRAILAAGITAATAAP